MLWGFDSSVDRVLITGASGFLGSELVRQATDAGMMVRAMCRSHSSSLLGVDHYRADILNPTALIPALDGIKGVIHAAGLAHVFDQSSFAAASFRAVNEVGTANVVRAAGHAGVQHCILISSVSVYGGGASGGDENLVCRPRGPYAESKWQAELRAIEIAKTTGLPLTILRLATLYGEGDPGNVARLMRAIDRGRFLWVGDGSNRKSLIHRQDAARACLAVLRVPSIGINIYNVASSHYTIRELVEELASALGRRVPRWRVPASFARGLTGMAARLTRGSGRVSLLHATVQKWLEDDVYYAHKFERAYGFQATVTLAEGLRREVAWYRSLGPQSK